MYMIVEGLKSVIYADCPVLLRGLSLDVVAHVTAPAGHTPHLQEQSIVCVMVKYMIILNLKKNTIS